MEEAKRRLPTGVYVHGSAYELPFPDESLDVVCGFGSYDVLMDLESAIKETSRVLKKGGLFFHMLDLYPCGKPIIMDLKKRNIPLQIKGFEGPNGYSQTESISFIPEEKLEDFHRTSTNSNDSDSDLEAFEKRDDKIWKRYAQEVQTHDYFGGKLVQSLLFHFSPETVESGKISAKYRGKRTEAQKQQPREPFVFFHDTGRYYRRPSLIDFGYRILKPISPSLAKILDPPCLEISVIKYAKARK